jgi:hypothetical protein
MTTCAVPIYPVRMTKGIVPLYRMTDQFILVNEWVGRTDIQQGSGGLSVFGEFDSDEDAGTGGVPLESFYLTTVSNIYGMPRGMVKQRVD